MKFWNYIGEFFLFRWIFGKIQHTEDNDIPAGKSSNAHGYLSNSYSYGSNEYDWDSQSYDDFHVEQDDYDLMDDF